MAKGLTQVVNTIIAELKSGEVSQGCVTFLKARGVEITLDTSVKDALQAIISKIG